jgi:hypothetical protein
MCVFSDMEVFTTKISFCNGRGSYWWQATTVMNDMSFIAVVSPQSRKCCSYMYEEKECMCKLTNANNCCTC